MSYGFCCSEAIELPPADQAKVMAGIAATGATYVRMSVPWSLIETSQGTFTNWPLLDAAVNAATAVKLKPLLVLEHPKPQTGFWLTSDASWATAAEYGKFCAAVVGRYPQVTDYELWNEPNLLSFWHPVDPTNFAPYLQSGYTAAKKANHRAQVALGGLAATVDYTGWVSSWSPLLFGIMVITAQPSHYLAGLYAAGCGGYFDAVAYHAYVANYSTDVPMEPLPSHPSFAEFANLRAVMVKNNDGAKEIWPTEWGFSTGTAATQVTPATQALWLPEQWNNMSVIPQTSHSCIFGWRNMGADLTPGDNFGVVGFDYTPKPALAALAGVLK